MSHNAYFSFLFLFFLLLLSCREPVKKMDDTPASGVIHISVDESFKPVITEQVSMFMALNPKARIITHYKPEADCLKDFFYDSATRLVITGRGLNDKEDRSMRDSLKYAPGWNLIAFDAIALLVHPLSRDTAFTKEEIRQYLTGKKKGLQVVFDGLKATSTIRYVRDSLLRGEPFDSSVMAARGSEEVIRYVSDHPGSLGLVGVSWLGNPEDSSRDKILKLVKPAAVRCETCDGKPYFLPSLENISSGCYPLTRGLYYIIRENYKGLGSGFVGFLKYEQGQLIFRRAYLRPVMNFDTRNVDVHTIK
jgi:phosphate transport system substrate-binding protein